MPTMYHDDPLHLQSRPPYDFDDAGPQLKTATVNILDWLGGDLLEDAWALYAAAFRGINELAVQRHLMYRHEFDAVMDDRRVDKHLSLDIAGNLCGMATYSNHLDAMPLISSAYFARRWPQHYAEKRIWYVGFVCASPTAPADTFADIVESLYQVVAERGGIVGLDFCTRNEQVRHLPEAVRMLLHVLAADVRVERADEQSYWLYEFPTPAAS